MERRSRNTLIIIVIIILLPNVAVKRKTTAATTITNKNRKLHQIVCTLIRYMGFMGIFMFSWMFQHDYLDTYCFECLIYMCYVFLYCCFHICSMQLSMFHMERRSRNTPILSSFFLTCIPESDAELTCMCFS